MTTCSKVSAELTVQGMNDANIEQIPDSYVVRFKEGVGSAAVEDTTLTLRSFSSGSSTFKIKNSYGDFGFSIENTPESALEMLRKNPHIAEIEVDQVFTTQQEDDPRFKCSAQNTLLWGLSRIDQDNSPVDPVYKYEDQMGTGSVVYVIDSGIWTGHPDFEGRATFGASYCGFGRCVRHGDGNGHGTHVAGTIGSKTYGVAKNVSLVGVQVLNNQGRGSTSDILSGINWAVNHWQSSGNRFGIINMSLGAGRSRILDAAVDSAHNKGMSVVVAAGNQNADSCSFSPARARKAITVACSDISDRRCGFSNWGSCVTVFAPGQTIRSTGHNGGTRILSGTSMAAPHVAGVIARYWPLCPTVSSDEITQWLINSEWPTGSIYDKVTNVGRGSPNRLLRFDCSAPFDEAAISSIRVAAAAASD